MEYNMMFKFEILLYLAIIFKISQQYNLKCPEPSQWNLTARACGKNSTFICMLDITSLKYKQLCSTTTREEEIHRDGYKYVLQPNPDPVKCDPHRYQPFMYTTNRNYKCVYLKSDCNGKGQVIHDNRTSSLDRTCRCDYRRGYKFIIPPINPCFCVPSEEDCSCYFSPCKEGQYMLADYKCIDKGTTILSQDIQCQELISSGEDGYRTEESVLMTDNNGSAKHKQRLAAVNTVFWLIIICMIFTLLLTASCFINVMPSVEGLAVISGSGLSFRDKDKNNSYVVIEGDTISLHFKIHSLFPLSGVRWQKVLNEEYPYSSKDVVQSEKYVITNGKYQSLTIKTVSTMDSGSYRCVAEYCFQFARVIERLNSIFARFHVLYEDSNFLTVQVLDLENQEKNLIGVYGDDLFIERSRAKNQTSFSVTKCMWVKTNGTTSLIDVSNNDKYKEIDTNSSLLIKNCGYTDAGKYICIIVDQNGELDKGVCSQTIVHVIDSGIYNELADHRANPSFVQIAAVDEAVKGFEKSEVVLVSGKKGSGKSFVCLELAHQYEEKGFILLNLNSQLISEETILKNNNILFIIDDNESDPSTTVESLQKIKNNERVSGLKILITCPKNVLWKFEEILLEEFDSGSYAIVYLDNALHQDKKKRKIFMKYVNDMSTTEVEKPFRGYTLEKNTIKYFLSDQSIDTIVSSDPWYGFPLTCNRFFESAENLLCGERYFTRPSAALLEHLQTMYFTARSDKQGDNVNQYSVLLYIFKNDNMELTFDNFNIDLFNKIDSLVNEVINPAVSLDKESMMNAANTLTGDLLLYNGATYFFMNPMLADVVKQTCPVDLEKYVH